MFDFDEFSLQEALNYPGSLAVLGTISILGPVLGLMPKSFQSLLLETFSLPFLFIFFIEVILNRNVDFKKNLALILIMSYLLHLARNFNIILTDFVNLHLNFTLAAILALTIVSVYYIFQINLDKIEKIIPKKQKKTKRFSFLFAFIPSLLVSFVVLYVMNLVGVL